MRDESPPAQRQKRHESRNAALSDKPPMSSLSLDLIARLARSAHRTGDDFTFLRVAPLLATHEPNRAEWILAYLRSLARLGLLAAVRGVIDRVPADQRTGPDWQALSEAADSPRDGRVAWTSRKGRFRANLAALERRDPDAARSVDESWQRHQADFELHQTRDGVPGVLRAGEVWPPGWIPFLDDHAAVAGERLRLEKPGLLPPPLAFLGIGLGYEFIEAYARTQRVFLEASSTIYVVEPKPELLAIALHVQDLQPIIADLRVQWFVGDNAVAAFKRRIEEDSRWPLTDLVFTFSLSGGDASELRAAMASAGRLRQQEVERLTSALDAAYAGRDARWWADRFSAATDAQGHATGEPLRILGLTSLHTTFLQYSMRDCLRAMEKLGHETKLLIEPSPHQPLDAATALRTQLEFKPDVVLLLSRMRYEMPGFIHPAIPSVTWDQDNLPWVFDPAKKPQLAWNDFLMGFAAASARRRFGWPEQRLMFCEMAGSEDTYSPVPLPEAELAPYRCDVSYVSHASATVEEEMRSVESWLPQGRLRTLFHDVAPSLLQYWRNGGDFPAPIMTPLIDACEARGWAWTVDELGRVVQVIQRLGDRLFRHVALGWAADWADRTGRTLRIYGNGWERHPRLSRYARGPTRNGEELRRIYQASAINLQLMAFGFLHQRALDGLMAGAFFLTRRSGSDEHAPVMRRLEVLLDSAGVSTWPELNALRDAPLQSEIVSLMRRWFADPRTLSPQTVEVIRCAACRVSAVEAIPEFDRIAFSNAKEFETMTEAHLADPTDRGRLASRMRTALLERFSYKVRMKDLLGFLGAGFSGTAPAAFAKGGALIGA